MANLTKRLAADQVLFRLAATFPDVAGSVQKQDIFKATEQWINSKFKMQHFSITLPSGETIPDNSVFATYNNVAVTSSNGKATSTLPVMPITLPRGVGVFDISYNGKSFIPILKGQTALLQSDFLLNNLFDQISYEQSGRKIIYSYDITLYGINAVDMVLAVFDMSQYSETDILPVPSDMEEQLIIDLYNSFIPIQPNAAIESNYPMPAQNK